MTDITTFTDDEIRRMQLAIDTGAVWADENAGRIAMALIESGKCKKAPGVLTMHPERDGRYRPIYSREELNRLVKELVADFPAAVADMKAAEAEYNFAVKYQGELTRLKVEEQLTPAFMPWTIRKVKAKYRAAVNALRAKEGLPPVPDDGE